MWEEKGDGELARQTQMEEGSETGRVRWGSGEVECAAGVRKDDDERVQGSRGEETGRFASEKKKAGCNGGGVGGGLIVSRDKEHFFFGV